MEQSIVEDLIGGMPSWTEEANCKGADADLFFPERGAWVVTKFYALRRFSRMNVWTPSVKSLRRRDTYNA